MRSEHLTQSANVRNAADLCVPRSDGSYKLSVNVYGGRSYGHIGRSIIINVEVEVEAQFASQIILYCIALHYFAL